MSDWYRLETSQVLQELKSDGAAGLSAAEAERRLQQYGLNELVERGVKSPWRILWEQLTAVMVLILIIAAVVSAFLGDWEDTVVILAIVVMNALLGLTQEYRAEKAIAALKKLAVPTVKVRRDGHVQEISARELVPGDLVFLEAGNLVPADGRVVESVNLRVQEAALTGESEPIEKDAAALEADGELPIGDRRNMVHSGTVITYGRGLAVVTDTGMKTQLGAIAEMLQTVEREPTPLQRRLDQLGRTLAIVALVIVGIVFVLGLIRGENIELMFLTAISMAVAAVPEGLPAVVTIALALGSQRMLKRRALIRKLPAVETLGSVTVICSDKTGTLTENRMTVTVLDVAGETLDIDTLLEHGRPVLEADLSQETHPPKRTLGLLVRAMALCNDAVLEPAQDGSGDLRAIGDPTEGALVVAAAELGFMKHDLEQRWRRVAEAPFTSERKRMTTVHLVDEQFTEPYTPWGDAPYVAFCKGAIDGLLELSPHIWLGHHAVPLDASLRERVSQANETMAKRGERVLGVAFRPLADRPPAGQEEGAERDLIFLGLVGMLDPARPEVKEAVGICQTAGIRPVMITGDHPLTAQHIARELRIASDGSNVLVGQQLAQMSIEQLERVVEDVPVYARVSPEHKLNIVQALQDKGHIVAMTGDGVNDAPALKKADIGVAMGITGTDVSKEAADMVLLDDNFATIVAAVEEGRVIYDNIRKFIKYILSSNTAEIWVMLLAPFLGMPLPLLPLQILWINLVTDGLPGLALAVEPAEPGTMQRKPYKPNESIFSRGMGRQILWVGILIGFVSLLVGYLDGRPAGFAFDENETSTWQTMIFTTLTFAQMANVLGLRTGKYSLFKVGLFSNKAMLGAVTLTIILQLAVIYVPILQRFFHTQPLDAVHFVEAAIASLVVFLAIEVEKWLLRRSGRD
ncbi:MAG: cation-translocating P-type ATPase [Chloroflexota bacterium]